MADLPDNVNKLIDTGFTVKCSLRNESWETLPESGIGSIELHRICNSMIGSMKNAPRSHVTSTVMEDERGTKLSSNLKTAFIRDPDIDEYDFLPVLEPTHNCNPLVLIDHKLGLELWAVKVLFDYAYNKVIAWRRKEASVRGIEAGELINLTRAVLMFNPDCITAWNIRKELVETRIQSVSDDLKLGALILTKHPKSPETFAHRKWLLLKITSRLLKSYVSDNDTEKNSNTYDNCRVSGVNNENNTSRCCVLGGNTWPAGFPSMEEVRVVVDTEMNLCEMAAAKYSNNYNAWSHRIWVLQHLTANDKQVLTLELQKTEPWVCNHVSDYSGFHYRQYLLTYLGLRSHQLEAELTIATDLILTYSGHESLWNHRRFVVQALMSQIIPSEISSESQVAKKTKVVPPCVLLLEQEVDFSTQIRNVSQEAWQQTLAKQHHTWLTNMFGDDKKS